MPPDISCGIRLQAPLRVGDADHLEQLEGPRAGRPRASSRGGSRGPRRSGGRRPRPGSATTSAAGRSSLIRSPRILRISSAGSLSRSRPSNMTSPASIRPGPARRGRMIDSDVTLLPQPDSPTRPMISPRSTWKSMPVDRPDDAVARVERGPQALDLEQRPVAAARRAAGAPRPGRAPRRPSRSRPGRASAPAALGSVVGVASSVQPRVEGVAQAVAEQVEAEAPSGRARCPGTRMRCGAVKSWPRSRPIIEPHSAVGGCAPRPRNDRAATSRTAPPMPSVPGDDRAASARWAGSAGRGCPAAISPRARDAVTKSRLRDRQDGRAHDPGIDRDRDDADRELGVDQARPEGGDDRDRQEQRRERPGATSMSRMRTLSSQPPA